MISFPSSSRRVIVSHDDRAKACLILKIRLISQKLDAMSENVTGVCLCSVIYWTFYVYG